MDDYLLAQHSEMEWVHWWFVGRRAIVADVLGRWLDQQPGAGRRVVDLGCGAGAMLSILRDFGAVEAIDTSSEAVAACRARFPDVDVRVGRVPESLPERGTADLITAFDVLEHIPDDREAVRAITGAMAPGGLFVCTVPAYQWLWGPHDELNHHQRRYTRRQLEEVLTAGGLEVAWASYFNTALLPVVAAVRIGRRLARSGLPPASDLDIRVGRANSILTRLFLLERHVLRRSTLPAGVSIVAVARRSETR
jgi:SAM-dependent methyltransferase